MTRSRLDTVSRVAALRESAARAGVAAASLARQQSEQLRDALTDELTGAALGAGTSTAVRGQLTGTARLAESVGLAGQLVAVREQERQQALATWSTTARRAQLLADLCARHRAERHHAIELNAQHLLDDLAARKGPNT